MIHHRHDELGGFGVPHEAFTFQDLHEGAVKGRLRHGHVAGPAPSGRPPQFEDELAGDGGAQCPSSNAKQLDTQHAGGVWSALGGPSRNDGTSRLNEEATVQIIGRALGDFAQAVSKVRFALASRLVQEPKDVLAGPRVRVARGRLDSCLRQTGLLSLMASVLACNVGRKLAWLHDGNPVQLECGWSKVL